jgi:hypothetical protein
MRASFVHRIGILVVAAALLACGASSPCEPPRYAEYSLDTSRHPESIECFYECLRKNGEKSREACFSECDGVIATATQSPCSMAWPALCRSYAIEEQPSGAENSGDDQTAEVVGEILGFAIRSGFEAATDDDDDDDDDDDSDSASSGDDRRDKRANRKSASPSKSKPSLTSAQKVKAQPSSFGSKAKKR